VLAGDMNGMFEVTVLAMMGSSSSSPGSMPLQEHCRFHDFTPLFTVICSVPDRPRTQVLLFEVVLYSTQPCLSRTTARSSPVLRRVIDASVEGPRVVLISIRTDDVAEESQTPGRDRLGDRRLSGMDANLLVGDMGSEGNLQNASKAPLIERIKTLARLHRHIPHF